MGNGGSYRLCKIVLAFNKEVLAVGKGEVLAAILRDQFVCRANVIKIRGSRRPMIYPQVGNVYAY
ncbi:hypothetical protein RJ45_17160 [Photobacterium gaetbulicola]|uniref:Uncharacterized protein n=1 Tax=Photobacterium gaetbulicola TaxID=1295392 RepID=A0A0B9GCA8_9GAMM|nr:hypothetical protein RJ45_17160 [Photobacterium gaetbulicola]